MVIIAMPLVLLGAIWATLHVNCKGKEVGMSVVPGPFPRAVQLLLKPLFLFQDWNEKRIANKTLRRNRG